MASIGRKDIHEEGLPGLHLVVFLRDMAGEKSPDEAVTLDGYTVFRGDRSARDSDKTRGGGTVIYVKFFLLL